MNIFDLSNLPVGTLIVHEKYGICHYVGLQQLYNEEFVVVDCVGRRHTFDIDKPDSCRLYIPKASLHLLHQHTKTDKIMEHDKYDGLSNSERDVYKKTRIVQGKYREDLIEYWKGKCAVTGFKEVSLLKASHIKPWRDCDDDERRDKFNGLLLTPSLDSAFDKGFISFNEIDGSMLISEDLSNKNKELLGIVTECSKLSKLDEKHKIYLRYHLSYVYENWKNNKK